MTPDPHIRIQDRFEQTPPDGVYARRIAPLAPQDAPRGALFLDRDGVINEDIGYLHKAEDLVIRPGIATRIGDARRAGLETVIVTNQSGIARGYYDWAAFEALHTVIHARLLAEDADAQIGMLCACPFHGDGKPPHDVADHPWRKPNPGMLTFAAAVLGLTLAKSTMIGDAKSDEEAAQRCGVAFDYA